MFRRSTGRSRTRNREGVTSVWIHVAYGLSATLAVVLTATTVWYVTHLPTFTIAAIDVTGGETVSHDEVRRTVEEVLNGSYLKLIPYRFTALYPEADVASAVQSMPRMKDVHLSRTGGTITVAFTEYKPYALWCASPDEDEQCFFLDETGYAFAPGPRLQGGALVRHMQEGEGKLEVKHVFETDSFRKTHAFLETIKERLGLRVTDVFYTDDGDVRLRVNGGGELLVRKDVSYDETYKNLESVLASEAFAHLTPGEFQYIDLRFGNKVFVNEEDPTLATTSLTQATSSTAE